MTAESALEFFDAFQMAAQCAVAAGDLRAAHRLGEALCDLPFYREEDHLATSRLIVVGLLSGAWDDAIRWSEMFRAGWERAGRPIAGNLRPAPYAVATVHALRGDDVARASWMEVVRRPETPGRPLATIHFGEFFDALVLLHRGQADDAVARSSRTPPRSSSTTTTACGGRGTRPPGPRRPSWPAVRTAASGSSGPGC